MDVSALCLFNVGIEEVFQHVHANHKVASHFVALASRQVKRAVDKGLVRNVAKLWRYALPQAGMLYRSLKASATCERNIWVARRRLTNPSREEGISRTGAAQA